MNEIPKIIYQFWRGPAVVVADVCMRRVKNVHPGWHVEVLHDVDEHINGLDQLSVQLQSDWVRLCAVARTGGVWLDATCICVAPVTDWIDLTQAEVQGFSAPFADDVLESWAFAAPPDNALVRRWKEVFRSAIEVGVGTFKKQLPDWVKCHAIYDHLPYLTVHVCYMIAARDINIPAKMVPSCKGPFVLHCANEWSSHRVVKLLMHECGENTKQPPPLIKLRGAETHLVRQYECRCGSIMSIVGMPCSIPHRNHTHVAVVVISLLAVAACAVAKKICTASHSSKICIALACVTVIVLLGALRSHIIVPDLVVPEYGQWMRPHWIDQQYSMMSEYNRQNPNEYRHIAGFASNALVPVMRCGQYDEEGVYFYFFPSSEIRIDLGRTLVSRNKLEALKFMGVSASEIFGSHYAFQDRHNETRVIHVQTHDEAARSLDACINFSSYEMNRLANSTQVDAMLCEHACRLGIDSVQFTVQPNGQGGWAFELAYYHDMCSSHSSTATARARAPLYHKGTRCIMDDDSNCLRCS